MYDQAAPSYALAYSIAELGTDTEIYTGNRRDATNRILGR